MKQTGKIILIALALLVVFILIILLNTEVQVDEVEVTFLKDIPATKETHQEKVSAMESAEVIKEIEESLEGREKYNLAVGNSNLHSQNQFNVQDWTYIYVIDVKAIVQQPTEEEKEILLQAIDSVLGTRFRPAIIFELGSVVFAEDKLDITGPVKLEYEALLVNSEN